MRYATDPWPQWNPPTEERQSEENDKTKKFNTRETPPPRAEKTMRGEKSHEQMSQRVDRITGR